MITIPSYWTDFVEQNALVGRTVEIPQCNDLSEIGASLMFLNSDQILDEATNFVPGMYVSKDGFVPVASDLTGSGDWYYINANEGINGAFYRIYHDSVSEDGYELQDTVVTVLNHYMELAPFLSTRGNEL